MINKHSILSCDMKDMDNLRAETLHDIYHNIVDASIKADMAIHSLLGNVPSDTLRFMHEDSYVGSLGYYRISDAYVVYDGCIVKDGFLLTCRQMNITGYNRHILEHFLPENFRNVIEIKDKSIVLYGSGWLTWGHWLVDFFPRIFLIEQSSYDINDFKWILPSEAPSYVFYFLKKIGINDKNIILFDHKLDCLLCNNLYLVKNFIVGMSIHPFMKLYFQWLNKKIDIPKNERNKYIYLEKTFHRKGF